MLSLCLNRAPAEGNGICPPSPRFVKITGLVVALLSVIVAAMLMPNRGQAALASSGVVGGIILLALGNRISHLPPRGQRPIARLGPHPLPERQPPPLPPAIPVGLERPWLAQNEWDQTKTFSPLYPIAAVFSYKEQRSDQRSKLEDIFNNLLRPWLGIDELSRLAQCGYKMNQLVRNRLSEVSTKWLFIENTYCSLRPYETAQTENGPQRPLRFFFNAHMIMRTIRPIFVMFSRQKPQYLPPKQLLEKIDSLKEGTVEQFVDCSHEILAALRDTELGESINRAISRYKGVPYPGWLDGELAALGGKQLAMFSILHALRLGDFQDTMSMRCTLSNADEFSKVYRPRWHAVLDYRKMQENLKGIEKLSDQEWGWTVRMAAFGQENVKVIAAALTVRALTVRDRIDSIENALKRNNCAMFELLCTQECGVHNRRLIIEIVIKHGMKENLEFLFSSPLLTDIELSRDDLLKYYFEAGSFGKMDMVYFLQSKLNQPFTLKDRKMGISFVLKNNSLSDEAGRRAMLTLLINGEEQLKVWAVEHAVLHELDAGQVEIVTAVCNIVGPEKERIKERASHCLPWHRGRGKAAFDAWYEQTLDLE